MNNIIKDVKEFLDYECFSYEELNEIKKKLLFDGRYEIYEQDKNVYFVIKNPTVGEIKKVLGYGY
jgi:hypothetical protein